MPEIIPCDDCEKPCGIHICTGCYEKPKVLGRIDGLKLAVKIAESRLGTAKACGYNESYQAAYEDMLVFLRAELYRQEHPDKAVRTTLD